MIGSTAENMLEEEIGKVQTMLNHSCSVSDQIVNMQKKESIQIVDSKEMSNYLFIKTNTGNKLDHDQNANIDKNLCKDASNKECNTSNYHPEKTVLKKPFTFEEDELLLSLVNSLGEKKDWILISFYMKKFNFNRSSRQCRDRYVHYLDPKIDNNLLWTPEEDNLLIKTVEKQGKKWKLLEKTFPGRSEVALRNRYHLLLRKIVKSKQNKEKKANVMSNKFAFLDSFYQRTIKSQKSQRKKEKKATFPIVPEHQKESISKIFNDSDFFSFGDENITEIDFDESVLMFE